MQRIVLQVGILNSIEVINKLPLVKQKGRLFKVTPKMSYGDIWIRGIYLTPIVKFFQNQASDIITFPDQHDCVTEKLLIYYFVT